MLLRTFALITGLLFLADCNTISKRGSSSNSTIKVLKTSDYTAEIKKISTFPAYLTELEKLDDKTDPLVSAYAFNLQAKMGEINGNAIDGGDAILTVIGKLKLNDPFQKAIKDLGNNGAGLSAASANFFADLSAKTKVDGFALPVLSGSYEALKAGKPISLKIYIFTNKTKTVTLTGEYTGISASSEEIQIANQNNDQGKAKMIALILKKTTDLGDALQKEIKGSPGMEAKTDPKLDAPKSESNSPVVKAEELQDLTPRQKLITYLYTGAIFFSWFIGL